jgi:mannosyltransferase OCH1-like enzyme
MSGNHEARLESGHAKTTMASVFARLILYQQGNSVTFMQQTYHDRYEHMAYAMGHQLSDANRVVQGLWIGSGLSVMEQLSINSFLRNGHDYHLYVYDELANIPAGTVIKDASEILPASTIFQYKERPSYAGFANSFRYKLLLERGGWWADMDVVCLRPFDFAATHVFATHMIGGRRVTANAIIKAPTGSSVMAHAWEVCQKKKAEDLKWGETGPTLMSETIERYGMLSFQQPYYFFFPIDYQHWHKVLEPYVAAVPQDAYAIHLWNEMWRLANQDKNAKYDPRCMYEQLKTKYL